MSIDSQVINSQTNGVKTSDDYKYKIVIVWPLLVMAILYHSAAVYGLILVVTGVANWKAFIYLYILGIFGLLGVLGGAHRLWSHRSYKANLALRILLMILETMAFEVDIFNWARDHRGHHKYSDTDGDPYNSSRGFFFCHIGWTVVKKHRDVIEKRKTIDYSDLLADPVVAFQHKYFFPLVILIWGIFPIGTAMYFFQETFWSAFFVNTLRWVVSFHNAFTINSFAHLYGMRPYDKHINPRNNWFVIYWGVGEGYHNYHHVFPYDYANSEFGSKTNWNPVTLFIDFFAWLGWAYDLKVAPRDVVKNRTERTGDVSLVRKAKSGIIDAIIGLTTMMSLVFILLGLRLLYTHLFA